MSEALSDRTQTTILVVDDTPANLRLLSGMLEEQGYRVRPAPNGRLALRSAKDDPPDLILLDIMMPGMDGCEVCRCLKEDEDLRDIPVIFISALTETFDKVKAFRIGGVDYITKPFQFEEVRARVETHIGLRRLQIELEARNQELAHRNEELVRLEKLRDDLTHMIVHDLNNPLTAILGRAQLMRLSEEPLTETQQKSLLCIEHAGNRLSRMIRNLLDISRMEEGRLELKSKPVRMEEIVQACVAEVKALKASESHHVTVQMASDLPVVDGDRDLLSRVVMNLLCNAMRYTPAGGEIRAEVDRSSEGEVQVSISDTGPGIAEEFQERVFEKFWQVEAKEAGQRVGSGLGLAFCRMAVDAHGGRIWVESEVGKGSTFRFTIPV